MRNRGVARIFVLLAILGILVVVLGGFIYLNSPRVVNDSYPVDTITLPQATTSVSETELSKPVARPAPQLSSSTTQVGEYTVTVGCINNNPSTIEISKNSTIVQNLNVDAAMTGIPLCVKAVSQDVNFDGYSDFTVDVNNGSGGTAVSYWLFNLETQKFYCPNGDNRCNLMNPEFNAATKTITSISPRGAGKLVIDIYQIVDGKLVLQSHEEKGN